MVRYMNQDLPDAVVILRDQVEEHLLCQMNYIAAWMNIPRGSRHDGDGDLTLGLAR